ncbi:MAG TPA: preprotein translocase subunit YajC [Nitrospiria bacterium]|nr:preprotein translocase subunit YajC [Nitrospiria bacterium]
MSRRTWFVEQTGLGVGSGLVGWLPAASVAYGQEAAAPAGPMGPLSGFIPFLLIIVLFYFLLILPQQRRQKKLKTMLEALKKDDKVVTTGGLYGTVKSLTKGTVTLEVAKGITMKLRRDAVAELRSDDEEDAK